MDQDACILPLSYKYSKYLFYSSFLIGVSSGISLYYKEYTTFLFLFMLFLSSINYWNDPDYGWGRNIDMFLCKVVGLYFYGNTLFFYDEFCQQVFINSMYSILFLFFMEHLYYHLKNKKWIIFHTAIHFQLAVFTPFSLYIL